MSALLSESLLRSFPASSNVLHLPFFSGPDLSMLSDSCRVSSSPSPSSTLSDPLWTSLEGRMEILWNLTLTEGMRKNWCVWVVQKTIMTYSLMVRNAELTNPPISPTKRELFTLVLKCFVYVTIFWGDRVYKSPKYPIVSHELTVRRRRRKKKPFTLGRFIDI